MKLKFYSLFILMIAMTQAYQAFSQENISTFEEIQLDSASYYNGSDLNSEYESGIARFKISYDTSWGGFWAGGTAVSNITDNTTEGFTNLYSAITGKGHNNSNNYGVSQPGARTIFKGQYKGFWVTNSTYAYYSMLKGDGFAKKFGGTSGDDPDFFELIIKRYQLDAIDTISFMLADFRFDDNSKDYIVKDWTYIDFDGVVGDSIEFQLNSSDIGDFGMNTPAFFCIDDLEVSHIISTNDPYQASINVFPNPATRFLNMRAVNRDVTIKNVVLTDATGKTILNKEVNNTESYLPLDGIANGSYFLRLTTTENKSIVKQVVIH